MALAWVSLGAISISVGMLFLVFAVFTTAIMKNSDADDTEPAIQELTQEYFRSVPSSFLTAFLLTVGGVQWGKEIIGPLLQSGSSGWRAAGYIMLAIIVFFTICIWKLVIGMFVRQVLVIARHYDEETERRNLYEGEASVERLRRLLEDFDADGDGEISVDEMKQGVIASPDALNMLGLGGAEVEATPFPKT